MMTTKLIELILSSVCMAGIFITFALLLVIAG
jgi:hypothetical protein